jgi:hypothetical protein
MLRFAKQGLAFAGLALTLLVGNGANAVTGNYTGKLADHSVAPDVTDSAATSQTTESADAVTGALSVRAKIVESSPTGVYLDHTLGVGAARAVSYARILQELSVPGAGDYDVRVKMDVDGGLSAPSAGISEPGMLTYGGAEVNALASFLLIPGSGDAVSTSDAERVAWIGQKTTEVPSALTLIGSFTTLGAGTIKVDAGFWADAVLAGAGQSVASASGKVAEISLLTCTTAPDADGNPVRTCA